MKKETLLTIAVVALLLLNFGTLGYLFSRRPPHTPEEGNRQLDRQIVETLHLNTAQQQQFEKLKKAHHEQMIASRRDYRDALGNYFALLKNDSVAPAQYDASLVVLSNIQKERAAVTFRHFSDLKNLCTPEQRQNFDTLLPELMQVILPEKQRRWRE